jgi:hypothetical protein
MPGRNDDVGGIRCGHAQDTDEGWRLSRRPTGLKLHAGDRTGGTEGSPTTRTRPWRAAYNAEIVKLRAGFDWPLPVDPRLEAQFLWGLDYVMKTATLALFFPHAFHEQVFRFRRLSATRRRKIPDRVVRFSRRGERFECKTSKGSRRPSVC